MKGFFVRCNWALECLLFCSLAGSAFAQLPPVPPQTLGVIVCEAGATPNDVRAEGVSELTATVVITCTNIPPPANSGPAVNTIDVNISQSLNVGITNNIDFAGPGLADAVLVVNGNDCTTPASGPGVFSCGPDSRFQDPQFAGVTSGVANRLEWNGVRFPVPGAAVDPLNPPANCFVDEFNLIESGECFPFTTTLEIKGVRANASATGLVGPQPIEAFVSLSGPTTIPVNNNVLNVAHSVESLIVQTPPATSAEACTNITESTSITISESFPTAFKPLGEPSFDPLNEPSEAGYFAPGSNAGGGASQGTRLFLLFIGAFSEVVTVPKLIETGSPTQSGDGLRLALIDGADMSGAGGAPFPDSGMHDLLSFGGAPTAIYEVLAANPSELDSVEIPITINADGLQHPTVSVLASYGPITGEITASAAAPEPRFLLGVDQHPLLHIFPCTVPSCYFTSQGTKVVRATGLAELLQDLQIVCQPGFPLSPDLPANLVMDIALKLNANITNNIDFGVGGNIIDAVLVVNDNHCTSPAAAGSVFNSCGAPNAHYQDPQFGSLVAADEVVWKNVTVPMPQIDPDGNGPLPTNPHITTLRMRSLRADATGTPGGASQNAPLGVVTATATISGADPVTLRAPPGQGPGFVVSGLTAEFNEPVVGLQCQELGTAKASVTLNGMRSFTVVGQPNFRFPSPFTGDREESGYFAPGSNNGGGASHGARILLRVSDVPAGLAVKFPDTVTQSARGGGTLALARIAGADENGSGGSLVTGTDLFTVPLENASGFVVYEVVENSPFGIDSCELDIWLEPDGGAAVGKGQIKVSATFAPLSTVNVADALAPEPRFIDSSGDPQTVFGIRACTTTLLFPYLSSDEGHDSDIFVSNITGPGTDLIPQTGECRLHFHGESAPADQTSAPIGPGEQLHLPLSSGNAAQSLAASPDFRGYLVTECDFESAAGVASLTNAVTVEQTPETVLFDQAGRVVDHSNLLFPFASSLAGFETEFQISNTTLDWLGTTPASGVCALNFFGDNAPARRLSPSLAAGEHYRFSLSEIAPDFLGFVIADCEFPLARAFAKVLSADFGFGVDAVLLDDTPAPLDAEEVATVVNGYGLLLPHATNENGLQTEMFFANTNLSQGGSCDLDFFDDAGSLAATAQIELDPAGSMLLNLADEVADFSGHITALCDFDGARLFAFTTSPQANFAQQAETFEPPRGTTLESVVYPSVVHADPSDTGLALANTSLDLLGTTAVDGQCELTFNGADAPEPTTVSLSAGEHVHWILSQGLPSKGIPPAPDFNGSIVASCDFPLARGLDYPIGGLPQLPPTPAGGPDLSVNISSAPRIASAGRGVTFRIRIVNDGSLPAPDHTLTAALRGLNSVRPPTGCVFDDSTLTCVGGPLEPGQSQTYRLRASVSQLALSASADVSVSSTDADLNPADNRARNSILLDIQADLVVGGAVFPSRLTPGGSGTLSLFVSNNGGGAAARDVLVRVQVPAGLTLTSLPRNCTLAGALECRVGLLTSGFTQPFQIPLQVSNDAAGELSGSITATSRTPEFELQNNSRTFAANVGTQ